MGIRVAAHDSSKFEADSADFRCDGISDQVEINASIGYANSVAILRTKYGNNEWFETTSSYLTQRYNQIEERMERTFLFVTLSKDNSLVHSLEFSSLLRDSGSTVSSVMESLVRNTTTNTKEFYDFRDYRNFITRHIPDIHLRIVAVNSLFPKVIIPFSALSDPRRGQPNWWSAYNKVKHSEVTHSKQGNLSNAFGCMAALAILGSQLGCFVRTRLFVNVGISYPQDDPAISSERILFDMN